MFTPSWRSVLIAYFKCWSFSLRILVCPGLFSENYSLGQICTAISNAAKDPRISGIYVKASLKASAASFKPSYMLCHHAVKFSRALIILVMDLSADHSSRYRMGQGSGNFSKASMERYKYLTANVQAVLMMGIWTWTWTRYAKTMCLLHCTMSLFQQLLAV